MVTLDSMKANRFETIEDMLKYLSAYRTCYYMWIALDAEATEVQSPKLDNIPGASHTELSKRWNSRIQKKLDYEALMESIRNDIDKLYAFDITSFSILNEKFIRFKTLEEISLMLHYSLSHMKNELYPRAKRQLFELLNEDSTE